MKWQYIAAGLTVGAVVLASPLYIGKAKDLLSGANAGSMTSAFHLPGADAESMTSAFHLSDTGDELGAFASVGSPIRHWAQNCWTSCGGAAGPCEGFCGKGNSCCKHGEYSDPAICHGVGLWPAFGYHTCVRTSSDDGLKMMPLQPTPPPPPEDMNPNHPPNRAMGYNGIAWPNMSFPGTQQMHILAIGDWGGMDGGVITEIRPKKEYRRIIQYKGGHTDEPHVMARSRPGCKFANLVECFNTQGRTGWNTKSDCLPACHWTKGVDDNAQILVADQFKKRAAQVDPQYILNVGDNFYWGGIETDCGIPMGDISPVTKHQFDLIYEGIYNGPGLDGKKWLSVLGNHDWGGRYFNAGWDQQMAYTWKSQRWVMPAAYYSTHADYPDQDFGVDLFMIDSNVFDADDLHKDPEHNICGALHTPREASCTAAGGPPSLAECKAWFQKFWHDQKGWLERKLGESNADWQMVVTHFPCGHDSGWYRSLHQNLGLDFLVTGHRHEQMFWHNAGRLGGMSCIVTGGGGGITSEQDPGRSASQYGFFDLAISKEKMKVELINWQGKTLATGDVYPKARP